MSYFGLNLLLNLPCPIALATLAQMCIIAVNDLDLSIGTFVGLRRRIGATWLVGRAAARRGGAGRCVARLRRWSGR